MALAQLDTVMGTLQSLRDELAQQTRAREGAEHRLRELQQQRPASPGECLRGFARCLERIGDAGPPLSPRSLVRFPLPVLAGPAREALPAHEDEQECPLCSEVRQQQQQQDPDPGESVSEVGAPEAQPPLARLLAPEREKRQGITIADWLQRTTTARSLSPD